MDGMIHSGSIKWKENTPSHLLGSAGLQILPDIFILLPANLKGSFALIFLCFKYYIIIIDSNEAEYRYFGSQGSQTPLNLSNLSVRIWRPKNPKFANLDHFRSKRPVSSIFQPYVQGYLWKNNFVCDTLPLRSIRRAERINNICSGKRIQNCWIGSLVLRKKKM